MPAKKRTRKDRSSSALPPDEKNFDLIKYFVQYYDYKNIDFDRLMETLPHKFPLKLGEKSVGAALVDWQGIFVKLVAATVRMSKPPDMSEEEYAEYFQALYDAASPEAKRAIGEPFLDMLAYVFKFLPPKLSDAVRDLCFEAHYSAVASAKGEARDARTKSIRQIVFKKLLRAERKAILARFPKVERQSKTKAAWKDDATLVDFANRVSLRQHLVLAIKKTYDNSDGDEDWSTDLQESKDYQLLITGVPKATINLAIRRVGDTNLSKREREPLSIACEMARRELDLPLQKTQTLRAYYSKGQNLKKKVRSRKNSG
jgi:hypothetical protein